MKTPLGIKNEIISNLEHCLDILILKDNGHNEFEIKRLYTLIYRLINEIKIIDAKEVLAYYKKSINGDVRSSLKRFNVELIY